jgi:hypothetical protein
MLFRHECGRMASCLHFRLDFPLPGVGVLALARFGTVGLSVLSAFDTVKTDHGYRCDVWLVGADDVSN